MLQSLREVKREEITKERMEIMEMSLDIVERHLQAVGEELDLLIDILKGQAKIDSHKELHLASLGKEPPTVDIVLSPRNHSRKFSRLFCFLLISTKSLFFRNLSG